MAKLLFDSITVGEIIQPLFCDETWYGLLNISSEFMNQTAAKKILAYKSFSEGWNERVRENPQEPPDVTEFDEFVDLTESDKWSIQDDAEVMHPVNAPLFLKDGEFMCRPWEFVHPKK